MKVSVRAEGHSIHIILPTNLIFSGGTAWLAEHIGRKYAPEAMEKLPPELLETLFAELRRIKKKHGKWELVAVESASGEKVLVTL